MVVVTLVVIGDSVCRMERIIFWNGVGITETTGGCFAIGIYETMGTDEVMVWVVNEGTKNTTGVTDTTDAMVIEGMGPIYENTRDKVGEGNTALVGADAEVGIRVGEMDTSMPYIN
ncbi:hypothetical protein KI387_037062 [Taxus chinensis]|uniref:Uncharacterized protein n=1 Tax=Taxus chinensis TaxID=29808 RepID=A0AA38FR63_TAXCH|nr:hypothetical protein KI387_037062 [Taxus chinensis]